MQDTGDAPRDYREAERLFRADAVDQRTDDDLADRIGEEKGRTDRSKFGVAQSKLIHDHRTDHGQRLPVEIIDRRDQAQQDRYLPTNGPTNGPTIRLTIGRA